MCGFEWAFVGLGGVAQTQKLFLYLIPPAPTKEKLMKFLKFPFKFISEKRSHFKTRHIVKLRTLLFFNFLINQK